MKNLFLGFLAVLIALAGCTFSETKAEGTFANGGNLNLMTWNVHNLFDGKDDGTEYDEFKLSAGWSNEKYMGRINTISAAIGKIEPRPDIIMFQEIESLVILEDLARSTGGYKWSHFAGNPGAALGVGMLSRYPILEAKSHSVTINGDTAPRPVLETRVDAAGTPFVIFVCHWKSKVGGDKVTENTRKASARVILRRIHELWENEPETGVIVAGDLNENHDEFFRQNGTMICALLPDDPYSASLAEAAGGQKDFIVISKNAPPAPVHFLKETIVLFSPWTRDLENGSYYYRRNWETIDHFLISGQFFNGVGWDYETARVVDFAPFAYDGTPVPYNQRTGAGLSDHLPLLLTLKMK